MILAFDTETTGVDFRHGTRPFFVTTCDGDGSQRYWGQPTGWRVDPLTRRVHAPADQLDEVRGLLWAADELVGHNVKFDCHAVDALLGGPQEWPWDRIHDTTIACHLCASNRPKNLTDAAALWLGIDISPQEGRLADAVKAARRWARTHRPDWALARSGRPDMPSAKDKEDWRADYWLPFECVRDAGADRIAEWLEGPCGWEGVLAEYAQADSEVTLLLHRELQAHVARRRLDRLYDCRRRLVAVTYRMELNGVTARPAALGELEREFRAESARLGRVCVNVARSYGHELELPDNGVNNSLRELCFARMRLDPQRSAKAKTDAPSLDKYALEHYERTLPRAGKPHLFVRSLRAKRLRDTALSYMESYRKFWVPCEGGDAVRLLHPSFNITGSDTLRFTCGNPNAQQISKKEDANLRRGFGPDPWGEWWSMDAENIEARLPAYDSGERDLIALFEEPDRPPYYGTMHLLNFHTVYPDVWDKVLREVGPEKVGPECKSRFKASYYQDCKNGGFAKQYGGQRAKVDATFKRAGAFDLLEQRFSSLAALNASCIRFANRHGYVETIPDRSVDPDRGYPIMLFRGDRGGVEPTKPLNYRIQGSAMWWTGKAMLRTQGQLDEWNEEVRRRGGHPWRDGYRLVLQVHDECVFRLPRRADPRTDPRRSNLARARLLARLMRQGGDDFGIPTPVGLEYHPEHWGQGFKFSVGADR